MLFRSAYFGPTEAGMLRLAVGDRWQQAYRTYLHAYERDHAPFDNLFQGIPEIIGMLRARGIRVGLVTGKGRDSALISVARTGLDAWLDAFETGSDEGLAKAAGIGRVLASWGVDPADAAYVGDTPDDMRSAVEAGVVALGAAWARTSSVAPPDATMTERRPASRYLCALAVPDGCPANALADATTPNQTPAPVRTLVAHAAMKIGRAHV